MDNDKLNAALYEKMSAEQDVFRDWLLAQPPKEILNHAYEYSVREDIVMAMEELDLGVEQAAALLDSPSPLGDIFKEFDRQETGHMDTIRECIETCADDVLKVRDDPKVQAEADRIMAALEKLTEPNSPRKINFMVPLSPDFNEHASTSNREQLLDKMEAYFPGQEFYFNVPVGKKEPYFFIKPKAVRQSEAARKQSIKGQLAAPSVPGDKPPTKPKDREVR